MNAARLSINSMKNFNGLRLSCTLFYLKSCIIHLPPFRTACSVHGSLPMGTGLPLCTSPLLSAHVSPSCLARFQIDRPSTRVKANLYVSRQLPEPSSGSSLAFSSVPFAFSVADPFLCTYLPPYHLLQGPASPIPACTIHFVLAYIYGGSRVYGRGPMQVGNILTNELSGRTFTSNNQQ